MKVDDMNWVREPSGFIGNNQENVNEIKRLLNNTGEGFCLAKFKQVTIHLGTGMTHSCHHPVPHKIPLDEIENNPGALFNTSVLKKARKEMLTGLKPKECDYCWRIEDKGDTSDRHYKSLEPWALSDHDRVTNLTGEEDIYPSYLEVSFSNACNLRCQYCGPEFSSTWVEHLKHHGPIKLLEGTKNESWSHGWQDLESLSYANRDFNPYIDAFWKWFPEAYKHLKHYRITGGEPLMSKETFKSMQWFIDNPNPALEFSINSNFSVPEKLWTKFIDLLTQMRDTKCVKKITIYTSVEGWGKRAEYARPGLDFELFRERCEEIYDLGDIRCVIMSTFNIFSVTSFKQLLEWMYEMKIKHNPGGPAADFEDKTGFKLCTHDDRSFTDRRDKNESHTVTVGIDIPYLRAPKFMDVQYCSHDMVEEYLVPMMEYIDRHACSGSQWSAHQGFEHYEIAKLKRIISHRMYFNSKNQPERDDGYDILVERSKFYEFVMERERRDGTVFVEVFPEMKEFLKMCETAREKLRNF